MPVVSTAAPTGCGQSRLQATSGSAAVRADVLVEAGRELRVTAGAR